ncbi:MAG: 6,7-dimethyl-8-ribityllumazine synthase [Patescibacteria group bacterium]
MLSDPLPLPVNINRGWRIGIVHSLRHGDLVRALVDEAVSAFEQAGLPRSYVSLHPCAGAFEIPLIGAGLVAAKQVEALVGFGVIVEGETHHARLIAEESARGIMDIQVRYRIPFAFEVLYARTLEQARKRCCAPYHKGGEAAASVLHSLAELGRMHS